MEHNNYRRGGIILTALALGSSAYLCLRTPASPPVAQIVPQTQIQKVAHPRLQSLDDVRTGKVEFDEYIHNIAKSLPQYRGSEIEDSTPTILVAPSDAEVKKHLEDVLDDDKLVAASMDRFLSKKASDNPMIVIPDINICYGQQKRQCVIYFPTVLNSPSCQNSDDLRMALVASVALGQDVYTGVTLGGTTLICDGSPKSNVSNLFIKNLVGLRAEHAALADVLSEKRDVSPVVFKMLAKDYARLHQLLSERAKNQTEQFAAAIQLRQFEDIIPWPDSEKPWSLRYNLHGIEDERPLDPSIPKYPLKNEF